MLKQARKLQAMLVGVRNYDLPTYSLTGVKCRATSVAKNGKKADDVHFGKGGLHFDHLRINIRETERLCGPASYDSGSVCGIWQKALLFKVSSLPHAKCSTMY